MNTKLFKQLAFAGIITTALAVFAAQRRVNIMASGSNSSGSSRTIELQNGSTTSVNYSLTCYSNGAVVPSMNNVSQTLAAKMGKTYGQVTCANGTVGDAYGLINGAHRCYSYVYAQRASACASGYTVCSFAEAETNYTGASSGGAYAWVELGTPYNIDSSGSFEVSDYSGAFSGGVNYSGQVAYFMKGGYKCRPAGGGTAISDCYNVYASNTNPVMCCPQPGTIYGKFDNCDVTIESTEAGFLQSHQFKSGAPF